jgi:hypothetical protein
MRLLVGNCDTCQFCQNLSRLFEQKSVFLDQFTPFIQRYIFHAAVSIFSVVSMHQATACCAAKEHYVSIQLYTSVIIKTKPVCVAQDACIHERILLVGIQA